MALHRSILLDAFGFVTTETFLTTPRAASRHDSNAVDRDSDALTMDSRIAEAYGEDAFRYFLEIERQRAEASGRSFLLLLVDLDKGSRQGPIDLPVADKLFGALASCVRETDFVGWYRQGFIVGGVLTQDSTTLPEDALACVTARVRTALATSLPVQVFDSTQVRAFRIPDSATLPA
jgi:hypothetical protein